MRDDLLAAREARDDAIQRVEEHSPEEFKAAALHVIKQLAEKQATIHPDDAREAITNIVGEPHEWRILGPLLLRAQREGWIRKSPIKRQSTRASNHAHERAVWDSQLYRPNPYEDVGRERKARALAGVLYRLDRDLPGQKDGLPLSERAAAMDEEFWNTLARVAGRPKGPSRATVVRAIEMLKEAESQEKAS